MRRECGCLLAVLTPRCSLLPACIQEAFSPGLRLEVISRARQALNTALAVGAWASLGFLRTEVAWRNTFALGALAATALGTNAAVLKWRAALARHKRRKAESELLKKGQ